eukprot:2547972-Pleurochrysis_carterae.AAC.2
MAADRLWKFQSRDFRKSTLVRLSVRSFCTTILSDSDAASPRLGGANHTFSAACEWLHHVTVGSRCTVASFQIKRSYALQVRQRVTVFGYRCGVFSDRTRLRCK